jgi:hypothetical protein
MSDDDIDLEMVISDPHYRRRVIELLNENGDRPARKSAETGAGGHKIMRSGSKLHHR